MKKIILFICFIAVTSFLFFPKKPNGKQVVGVIVPMEHTALTEIVEGLKKTLPDVTLKVLNAQGDPNLQKSIIEKLKREGCDLLIPIGTTASQMTLTVAKGCKTLCLAADPSVILEEKRESATVLTDELSTEDSLSFLCTVFPGIEKLSLVYSASEKVAAEIPRLEKGAATRGIKLQKLLVYNMGELHTAAQAIDPDSRAIFILKDHTVVAGVSTLALEAQKRKIPLVTSDEGSVINGGAFAVGVKESATGILGGLTAKRLLAGTLPKEIPPQRMEGPFSLFINRSSCVGQGVDPDRLFEKAKEADLIPEYRQGGPS